MFVQKYPEWLHPQNYATFFLFKVEDEFFVAGVGRYGDGGLGVGVGHFSSGDVWGAERRSRVVLL
mgnify:FL=1